MALSPNIVNGRLELQHRNLEGTQFSPQHTSSGNMKTSPRHQIVLRWTDLIHGALITLEASLEFFFFSEMFACILDMSYIQDSQQGFLSLCHGSLKMCCNAILQVTK